MTASSTGGRRTARRLRPRAPGSGHGRDPDRTSAFVEAVALTGFNDRAATYWSGRATLCSSLDDSELYDKAFTAWFTPHLKNPDPPRRFQRHASRKPHWNLNRVLGMCPEMTFSRRARALRRCCATAMWELSPSRSERSSPCSSTASRWWRRSGERFDNGPIIAARSICDVRCAPSCVPAANWPGSAAGGPAYVADESSC